ncbi:MAG TPA: ATP-binding protein [Acidimicrobiales bacterium]|nr:ATP-binding protein [Acidimicrobiales bacterium]
MSYGHSPLRARRVLEYATNIMTDAPVVLLEGPRTVGKSTLLHQIVESRHGELIDLDDVATRDAVNADPSLAIDGDRLVCVDEYQKAPVILDAIKAALNQVTHPGRFVLTDSARHDALPPAAQALTGRLATVPVYPLSQGEQAGIREDFLERAIYSPTSVVSRDVSSTTRDEYVERICRGGFPLAIAASSDVARRRWLRDYVALTLERDVRELSNLRQGDKLTALLGRLAGQTAQILNVASAARAVDLEPVTAESYLRLLEKVFLVYRLEAWGKTLISRTVAKPKLHVLDSAVAATLLRLTPAKLATRNATASSEFGHLLETFVVGELRKQASWIDAVTGLGHWRSHDGGEVDLVVETEDGGLVGFEVKAASRASAHDVKGLRELRRAVKDNFIAGYVLYLGERTYSLGEGIHVVAIDRLWTPGT